MPDLPEEAVEAASVAMRDYKNAGRYTEAAIQAAAPAIRKQERERLGIEECPNCDEGIVCVTGTERGPEGEPIPVPEQERCSTCGGSNFMPACFRATIETIRNQRDEELRERLRELAQEALNQVEGHFGDERDVPEGEAAAFERAADSIFEETDDASGGGEQ